MFKRLLKNFNETERSWILYDVGNSAYTLAIVTVFFPIIFQLIGGQQRGISADEAKDYFTPIFQYATSIYALIIALIAPLLGNLADYKGMKKRFFKAFLFMGLIFGVLLCIPTIPWQIYLAVYMIATIGYAGANVFYDSFLTDVTEEDRYDYVSSSGFAWGYIGSCIPFVLGLIVYALQMDFNGDTPGGQILDFPEKWAIAIAFLISIIWWGLYSLPLLKNVEQKYYVEKTSNWLSKSFSDLVRTFKKLSKEPKILLFLIGYFFYIDAVGTIIKSATNIGTALKDVNGDPVVGVMELLVILFIVQIIAFPCAIIFGLLAKKVGDVKMLSFGIFIYIAICTIGYFINEVWHIFVFAGLVGVAQGGIQAVSRSYFGKLIPKHHSGEFYGFFNIFGKFAAIMGPALLGFTVDITGDAHYGTLSLIPLLLIGFIFLVKSSRSKPTEAELKRAATSSI